MKPRKNTKRVPSFRKLLKTSKIKLDNKLKNKQLKQQSTAKKYRKEQRKLRQAVKDVVSRKPVPLEDYKKKPPAPGIQRYSASKHGSTNKTRATIIQLDLGVRGGSILDPLPMDTEIALVRIQNQCKDL